ncbi:hypothetical protein GJ496_012014 [Pomphorhynchus laevis]|nr:hypothetical protein GJ496_012014 [Pomphorhynchus laevis]
MDSRYIIRREMPLDFDEVFKADNALAAEFSEQDFIRAGDIKMKNSLNKDIKDIDESEEFEEVNEDDEFLSFKHGNTHPAPFFKRIRF